MLVQGLRRGADLSVNVQSVTWHTCLRRARLGHNGVGCSSRKGAPWCQPLWLQRAASSAALLVGLDCKPC